MNSSKFFVPAAVAATVVAVAGLAYAQSTTTSPTPTHPAVQATPNQPMPADSTTSPTSAHPAMQGGPGQPTPSTGTPVTTTRVVPADISSMITERPARGDRN